MNNISDITILVAVLALAGSSNMACNNSLLFMAKGKENYKLL